jgi:TonB family protein
MKRRRCPAWLISIGLHAVMLVAAVLLVPAMVTYHKDSFGPPVQVVERVEPEERILPKWKPEIEILEEPPFDVVIEPVREIEAEREMSLADADIVDTTETTCVSSSVSVVSVGVRTRPRPRPVKKPVEAPVVKVPPKPVYRPVYKPPPPPPPPVTRPVVVGPSRAARVVSPPQPRYPERQRRAGRTATVMLSVRIGLDGKPVEVKPMDDGIHSDFIRAAISAARNARYEPAMVNGKPVVSTIRVRIRFQLR